MRKYNKPPIRTKCWNPNCSDAIWTDQYLGRKHYREIEAKGWMPVHRGMHIPRAWYCPKCIEAFSKKWLRLEEAAVLPLKKALAEKNVEAFLERANRPPFNKQWDRANTISNNDPEHPIEIDDRCNGMERTNATLEYAYQICIDDFLAPFWSGLTKQITQDQQKENEQ